MERPTPNPIIPGFAPDPSVCLIEGTFFLANSSFHVFPGIPIYTSKDLISWTHIGNAINRPSQLSLLNATTDLHPGDDGNTIIATGGLYAPTIRRHKGITYILCTNMVHGSDTVKSDQQNFFIHTKDPYSNDWSDPIYYDFKGIDPSILFDDDGKVYIQGTSNDFKIYNMEVDLTTGDMITKPKLIWKGWKEWYTEGPHIYKRGEWYYLMCAEGGTFNYHMETMARSKSIWGPFESCPRNPLWTASGTDNYVQFTGHADLFQDSQLRWWAVMLGVRRTGERYGMGRESFLTPVEWIEGDWPVMKPVVTAVSGISGGDAANAASGPPMSYAKEGVDWVYLRAPDLERYDIRPGGVYKLQASPVELTSSRETVTFLGKRQRLLAGNSTVMLRVNKDGNEAPVRAGLAVYTDELRFAELSYDFTTQKVVLNAQNTVRKFTTNVEKHISGVEDILFRVSYTDEAYQFYWRTASSSSWTKIGEMDTLQMSGFDFTGPLIGMIAIGSDVAVEFEKFVVDVSMEK